MSSYFNLALKGLESSHQDLGWGGDHFNQLQYLNFNTGYKNESIDLSMLPKIALGCPTWLAAYQKGVQVVIDFGQVYEKTKDGKLINTEASKAYNDKLDKAGHERLNNSMLVASLGLGMGGAVGYKLKKKGEIKLHLDPYVTDFFPRVAFWGDQRRRSTDIEKVEILDYYGQEVYTFPYKDVYHYQYLNPTGTNAFGINGVSVAIKYMYLEYLQVGANSNAFKNGMHVDKIASLDHTQLKNIGVNARDIQRATELLKERLSESRGVKNAGKLMFLPYPMQFDDVGFMNNSQMRTNDFLDKTIPTNILKAMGFDTSILSVRDLKYNTVDLAIDLLYQSLKPFTRYVEKLHNDWSLPTLDPTFDKSRFVYKMKRQVTLEEIKIKAQKTKETQVFFQNLKTANEVFSNLGLVALPSEDKLKYLEEQGMKIETLNKDIKIKPSSDNQTSDYFTSETTSESVRQLSYYEQLKKRLDSSFEKLYNK